MDASIHNVKKVEVTKVKEYTRPDRKFYVRKILITGEFGEEELALFSKDKKSLKF